MLGLIDADVDAAITTMNLAAMAQRPLSLVALEAAKVFEGMLRRRFTSVRDADGADRGTAQAVERGLVPAPRLFYSGCVVPHLVERGLRTHLETAARLTRRPDSTQGASLVGRSGNGREDMSLVPSVKGSVFGLVVEELKKLVESDEISRAELGRRLSSADVELIEGTIHVTGWYDVRTYARILELLRDVVGDGDDAYLIGRGARSAESLLLSRRYQQLDYLERVQHTQADDPHARYLAFGRDLRLLSSLRANIVNFGDQQVKQDPEHADRYVLEISDAGAFPDVMCWTTQGFNNRMAAEHGAPDLWRWERPRRDLVLYLMNYSV